MHVLVESAHESQRTREKIKGNVVDSERQEKYFLRCTKRKAGSELQLHQGEVGDNKHFTPLNGPNLTPETKA